MFDMPRLNKLHYGLVLTVISFLLIGYWLVKPELERYPAYVSFSPDLNGTKALRELLVERQAQVKSWDLAWKHLPRQSNQLLIAIQPEGITEDDHAELRGWLEQGNDLIMFHDEPYDWEEFTLDYVDGEDLISMIYAGDRSSEDEGLTALVGTGNRLSSHTGQQLFADADGILGSRMAVGEGSITVVLAPDWLTNNQIVEHSHFELVWPLFSKQWDAVWFDESHHGYQQKPGLLAVYPAWLIIACMQLGAALLLWLWLRGKRFGPVYTPRAWTVRRGDETLQAVAGWYERLGLRGEALIHQQQLLRQLLYEHWGLSPSASTAQAAALARSRWPEAHVARLVRLLEPGGEQSPQHAKAFMHRTHEMNEIIALIEQHSSASSKADQ
jgi:hypothetical protein